MSACCALQAAYASYLARDDSGAIAVFLDDPAVSLLQISAARAASGALSVRLSNAPGFPASCFFQVGWNSTVVELLHA
jgi:hypothetical protein